MLVLVFAAGRAQRHALVVSLSSRGPVHFRIGSSNGAVTVARAHYCKLRGWPRGRPLFIVELSYIMIAYPETAPSGNDIIDQVGNTPLLRLERIASAHSISPEVEIYAKAEWFNPGGSVKDRAALWMIREGERRACSSRARPSSTPVRATRVSPTP